MVLEHQIRTGGEGGGSPRFCPSTSLQPPRARCASKRDLSCSLPFFLSPPPPSSLLGAPREVANTSLVAPLAEQQPPPSSPGVGLDGRRLASPLAYRWAVSFVAKRRSLVAAEALAALASPEFAARATADQPGNFSLLVPPALPGQGRLCWREATPAGLPTLFSFDSGRGGSQTLVFTRCETCLFEGAGSQEGAAWVCGVRGMGDCRSSRCPPRRWTPRPPLLRPAEAAAAAGTASWASAARRSSARRECYCSPRALLPPPPGAAAASRAAAVITARGSPRKPLVNCLLPFFLHAAPTSRVFIYRCLFYCPIFAYSSSFSLSPSLPMHACARTACPRVYEPLVAHLPCGPKSCSVRGRRGQISP